MGWSDEPSPAYKDWRSSWDGSMMCGCDHGCNQWLKKNHSKASLMMRVMESKGNTSLDKIARMSLQKSDKVWYFLQMRESKKFNEELRRVEREEK